MFLDDVLSDGAMPVLEASMRFAGQRQRITAHNLANVDTPGFRATDADPGAFQEMLRRAVDGRRARTGGQRGVLSMTAGEGAEWVSNDGDFGVAVRERNSGLLFHDRNDRDMERLMQDVAENVAAYRVASELLRSRMNLMRSAIAERVA